MILHPYDILFSMNYKLEEIYAIGNLSSTEKLILAYLYSSSDEGTHAVNMSFKNIANACSVTSPTAIRNTNSLVAQGYLIKRNRSGDDNGDRANQYELPRELPEGTVLDKDVIRKNILLNTDLQDDARWVKASRQAPTANTLWVSAMSLCRCIGNDGTITATQLKVSCRGAEDDIEYMLDNGMLEPVEGRSGVYRICDYATLSTRGERK
jgi:DNA-binding MarR family transcriptional regulator